MDIKDASHIITVICFAIVEATGCQVMSHEFDFILINLNHILFSQVWYLATLVHL